MEQNFTKIYLSIMTLLGNKIETPQRTSWSHYKHNKILFNNEQTKRETKP